MNQKISPLANMLRCVELINQQSTLSEKIDTATTSGFCVPFQVKENVLFVSGTEKIYQPAEIVRMAYVFHCDDSDSDPGGDLLLFLLSTTDHTKGWLINNYGLAANLSIHNFIRSVETALAHTYSIQNHH